MAYMETPGAWLLYEKDSFHFKPLHLGDVKLDLKPLDLRLLYEIQKKPRAHITELCRILNSRYKFYCGNRSCFANARKKKNGSVFRCECNPKREPVRKSLVKLDKLGIIQIQIERKADSKNARGWDFMKCCYSTLAVAFGGL